MNERHHCCSPRHLCCLVVLLLGAGCAWYRHTPVQWPQGCDRVGTIEPLPASDFGGATPGNAGVPDSAHSALAPPSDVSVSIESVRATALSNNLGIRATLLEPRIANDRVCEAEARFEAVFRTEASYATSDTPTATTLEGSRVHHLRMETGVDMPLRTGGTLRFSLADQRTKTNNPFSILNPSYATDVTVSFSQPLLRNAGRYAATQPIRLARYEHELARTATQLEIIRVLTAADRVYWRLYAARRVLEVRRQDYELAKAQRDTARRLVRSGERSQVEILRAEAALASRLEGIINAENALRARQRELKRVLNRDDIPVGSATVILPATEPDPVHYQLDGARLVDLALKNRMELLELELLLARDDSTIEYLNNQQLPLVTLDYVYNVNGLGEARWDAYDLLESRRFADHYVGARLLVPIGNEAAESRLRQALLARRQRLVSQKARQQLIRQEVLDAGDNLEAAWQRILASRQTVLLANRLLNTEQRQFELGLNTSNDVLEAQTKVADAQSAEIEALVQYQIAFVDLAYATGTVMGAARVRWDQP